MKFVNTIKYADFENMMTQCFPFEVVDKATFSTNISKHRYIFIIEKGIPCGYALFDPTEQPAKLIHLCVDDHYRNLGFGALLLQKLIDTLVNLGSTQMSLNVDSSNHGAIHFYENFGFEITDSLNQYHCDLSKSNDISKKLHLAIVTEDDRESLAKKYNLGGFLISYFITSTQSLFYKVLNESNSIIGYLVYDKNQHVISPMMLDNPEDILEIIPSFAEITQSEEEITIKSTRGGIKDYIERSNTISVDFRLEVMTLDIV